MLITVNLKYALYEDQVFLIAQVIVDWSNGIDLNLKNVARRLGMELFHPDLINELVNINKMYDFMDEEYVQIQLFVKMIRLLLLCNKDWNICDDVRRFYSPHRD